MPPETARKPAQKVFTFYSLSIILDAHVPAHGCDLGHRTPMQQDICRSIYGRYDGIIERTPTLP